MAIKNLGRVRGFSAFEIAQKNGFEGTEQEWLASLKGERGPAGANGDGSNINLDDYYTKSEIESNYAQKSEIPEGVDLDNYYTKEEVEEKISSVDGGSERTYEKFVVVGINGQSNSVGYDESPLTLFDIPRDKNRIMQYSDGLKPLTYMAESIQMMNAVGINGKTSQANDRMTKDAWYEEDRQTQAKTKGLHLPLANLILDVIPEDYGVIIVPGSVGGQSIAQFMKNAGRTSALGVTLQSNIYTEFVRRLKAAMDLNDNNIFCGIIWCQGENNCGNSGDSYLNSLRTLITDTNNELQGYVKRSTHGSITEKDWYFYEWPVFYKQKDTGGILNSLKTFFGSRYVPIPDDTPYNATQFTSSEMRAHFADNSFRKTIAPRVFNAMQSNGAFLCNSFDNDTKTAEVDTSSFATQTQLLSLNTQVEALRQAIQNLGGNVPETGPVLRTLTQDMLTQSHTNGGSLGTFVVDNGTLTISGGGGVGGYLLPEGTTHFEGTFSQWNSQLASFILLLAKNDEREEGLFIPKLNNFQKYISNASLQQGGTINGEYATTYSGTKVGAKLTIDIIDNTKVKVVLDGNTMYEYDLANGGMFDGAQCTTPVIGFACSWSAKGVAWELTDCKIS